MGIHFVIDSYKLIAMSCVDIREQFLSYADCNGHQSSYWNQPAFMKSCNEALLELETLRMKVK